jgi:aquaporin Z
MQAPQKQVYQHPAYAKYTAEFIGTYFLVLTIGMNVLTGSVGAAISIGGMLMVMIFSAGSISGAHFNPAVSFAVLLSAHPSRKTISLSNFFVYTVFQCMGAWAAGLTYYSFTGHTFTLAPVGHYSWGPAMVCELLYSMALCYVVLNVATTKKSEGNQYFGLAIGFTVTAAALAIGGVSGCSLNPAVTFGLMSSAALQMGYSAAFRWFPLYFFTPFIGAAVAFGAFYVVRKVDEFSPRKYEDRQDDRLRR